MAISRLLRPGDYAQGVRLAADPSTHRQLILCNFVEPKTPLRRTCRSGDLQQISAPRAGASLHADVQAANYLPPGYVKQA